MSQINIRNLSNENDDGSPEIVGVSTFSATSFFVPPKGTTAERPSDCEPGSIRFNTDTANLEYFRGKTIGWSQFELVTPNLGGGTGSNTGLGVRGLVAGGYNPSSPHNMDNISFLTVSTMGDAQDFGNLSQARYKIYGGGCASRTRGLWGGGYTQPGQNRDTIDFVTYSSTGNATDFGNLLETQQEATACANQTRGVWMGGAPHADRIQYVTIASTGNSVNFGDASVDANGRGGLQSSTRGLFAGGEYNNVIEFITINTLGNGTDFGDLTESRRFAGGGGNSTRGIFAGGGIQPSPNVTNVIDFVTIASAGVDASDFGDLSHTMYGGGSSPSPTRMCVYDITGTSTVAIDKIEIATLGNGVDFGDTPVAHYAGGGGQSNGHGGL